MADEGQGKPVTESHVKNLANKLHSWSKDLPPEEQALLHVMLARAQGVAPEDLEKHPGASVSSLTSAALQPLLKNLQISSSARTKDPDFWDRWSARQF